MEDSNSIMKKKVWYSFAVVIFVIASVVIAVKCQVPSKEVKGSSSSIVTQWITMTVNGFPITMDFYNTGIWYDAVTLNTEFETEITAGEFSGYTITVNGTKIEPNHTVSLKLDKLKWDLGIEISATETNSGTVRTHYIRTLPSSCCDWDILSDNPEKGYYYFNLNNAIDKMDTSREIVFFKTVSPADVCNGGMDFKRTEVGGKVYYSYLTGYTPVEHPYMSGVGYGRMCAVVMNEQYEEIDHIMSLLPTDDIPENYPLENHQFTILGEKHYILSSYIGKRVYNIPDTVSHSMQGARVVACVLQEMKNGELLWSWDSTDYPELYEYSVDGNDFFNASVQWADYAHFNAITVDPRDQNFVCSFGHLNCILKLDRKTGDILWVLGGKGDHFGLSSDQMFSHQHDVKVTEDGGITLFNNGNIGTDNSEGQTSIMKFYLDEDSKSVVNFEEYFVEQAFSPAMGSTTELSSGHYIIGWGSRISTSQNAAFSEIDFNTNKVLFEFIYPVGISDPYRVYKFTD